MPDTMKWPFAFALATAAVVQAYLFTPARAEEVVRLAVGEWKPFISKSLPKYGPALEVVSRAFANEGIRVEYTFRPWKRAMVMTKRGKFDGTPGWVFSDERALDFDYSDSLLTQKDSIIFRRDNLIDFKSAADFSGKRTLTLIGSYIGDEFNKLAESGLLAVKETRTYSQMFKMLLNKETDFLYLSELVSTHIMKSELSQHQRDKIVAKDSFRNPHTYHLLVSKKSMNGKRLLKAFNSGLRKLRTNGAYDLIISKAYLQDR